MRHGIVMAWMGLMCSAGMAGLCLADEIAPPPFTSGHFRVLNGAQSGKPPFAVVNFIYGPREVKEDATFLQWQLEVRETEGSEPLFQLRALTAGDPLADDVKQGLYFYRYQLFIPETGEKLEYVDRHTNKPQLPGWELFEKYFIPQAVFRTERTSEMPRTCNYLGHVLSLQRTSTHADWPEWNDVKVLKLDSELFIGTSRSMKDMEGKRISQEPERQDYKYIQFNAADYKLMIEAGINEFTVRPEQEQFVRSEPVFYIRGANGNPALRYPADLYRSNYLGATMFMDEPTILMIGDENVHTTLQHFSDAAALITKRVRSRYLNNKNYGAYNLEGRLESRGISFGDMRLAQLDFPSWETRYETAYYQLAGGLSGIVHEGRYQLDAFNEHVKASTGIDRTYTAEEMMTFYIANLRGAARHFNKGWGLSIYGQADPKISPIAMKMAFDRGARYLWYWTSDHDHHLPFPEQMELTRMIRAHAQSKGRQSIHAKQPKLDKLILIPWGYFLTLESPTSRKGHEDLWWIRSLDPEKKNDASKAYRRLMEKVFIEINKSLDKGEEYDLCIDDRRPISGYKQVIRLNDQ